MGPGSVIKKRPAFRAGPYLRVDGSQPIAAALLRGPMALLELLARPARARIVSTNLRPFGGIGRGLVQRPSLPRADDHPVKLHPGRTFRRLGGRDVERDAG